MSQETLKLTDMPEISIESRISNQGYGLKAEDTFWCKQGVIRMPQLRDSEDEEIIADIAASILLGTPLARSRDLLDQLYSAESKEYQDLEKALNRYTAERLSAEIKATFSVLGETIEKYDANPNCFRRIVNPSAGPNAVKTEFYAVYMAFFRLVVQNELTPNDQQGIMTALQNLHSRLERGSSNTIRTDIRTRNIDLTIGLIQNYFVYKDPPLLGHGAGLALDFENSLRRSRTETPRYEHKQGILTLSPNKRERNSDFVSRLVEHICAIANIGPEGDGFIYIGVADKLEDAQKIESLDSTKSILVTDKYVVGIDREARILGISIEQYANDLSNQIRASKLSDPLKSQILSHIDTIEYKGLCVIRILVPIQKNMSFVGDEAFVREGSSTQKITGRKVIDIAQRFGSRH